MRRFLVPGIISIAAVALLALLAFGVIGQGTGSSIDGRVASGHYPLAPNSTMALPLLGSNTGTESLADLKGKVVLVNVFASWCIPCAQEAPVLEQAEHMLNAHDGTVLGVTYLDNPSDSESFMREHHLTYPVVRDVNGNFVRGFGTTGVPESFVINRQGRIEALRRYQLSSQWVDQTLPRIISQRS
jgi:cytochrome c biogenesis protein CcmG, thiol:disulfide interchange protein DsbE